MRGHYVAIAYLALLALEREGFTPPPRTYGRPSSPS